MSAPKRPKAARMPDWTDAEFERVVENPMKSDEEVALLVLTRTADAIAVVRDGIHAFHTGGALALSVAMRRRLQDSARPVECPRCRATV